MTTIFSAYLDTQQSFVAIYIYSNRHSICYPKHTDILLLEYVDVYYLNVNATESPSVDLLLSESLKTLDLKKGSPKVKRFQQSSFQTHKPPGATQPTTFISSDKARNWSSASDELSGMFSEADEFTQFEAAPLQQQGNQGIK